jgi:hypothetical protein
MNMIVVAPRAAGFGPVASDLQMKMESVQPSGDLLINPDTLRFQQESQAVIFWPRCTRCALMILSDDAGWSRQMGRKFCSRYH